MDLVYMADVMSYQTMRNPIYDKYNSWDPPVENKVQKNRPVQKKKKEKEPCKICQERQRRSLMKYIRSKSHDHSEQGIQEEEEEEEEEVQETNKEKKEETRR